MQGRNGASDAGGRGGSAPGLLSAVEQGRGRTVGFRFMERNTGGRITKSLKLCWTDVQVYQRQMEGETWPDRILDKVAHNTCSYYLGWCPYSFRGCNFSTRWWSSSRRRPRSIHRRRTSRRGRCRRLRRRLERF